MESSVAEQARSGTTLPRDVQEARCKTSTGDG